MEDYVIKKRWYNFSKNVTSDWKINYTKDLISNYLIYKIIQLIENKKFK